MSWCFEKLNKTDKTLARTRPKRREGEDSNNIRNERGEITTNATEIQRIIREYNEKLFATYWTPWKKWINAQKHFISQNCLRNK